MDFDLREESAITNAVFGFVFKVVVFVLVIAIKLLRYFVREVTGCLVVYAFVARDQIMDLWRGMVEEEIPPPPPPTIYEEVLMYMRGWVPAFAEREALILAVILGLVVFGMAVWLLVSAFRFVRYMWRVGFKVRMMKLRGVCVPEAMISGSEFRRDGEMPTSQIAIMIPGVLSDAHTGYGVRVRGGLMTAKHVLSPHLGDQVVLQSSCGKKILWRVTYTESHVYPDQVLCSIGDDEFSRLGATVANLVSMSARISNAQAKMYGRRGMTTGMVRLNPEMKGFLVYGGSSVPGMSGGGVWVDGKLAGIHEGSNSGYNMSAYAPWVHKSFSITEAASVSSDSSEIAADNVPTKRISTGWTTTDYRGFVNDTDEFVARKRASGAMLWSDIMDEEALVIYKGNTYKRTSGDLLVPSAVKFVAAPVKTVQLNASTTVKESALPSAEISQESDEKIPSEQVENSMKGAAVGALVCSCSRKVFVNAAALQNHMRDRHGLTRKENFTEFRNGAGDEVSFLDSETPCQQTSGRDSETISGLWEERPESTSSHPGPEKPLTSDLTRKSLKRKPQNSTGPSSEKQQN